MLQGVYWGEKQELPPSDPALRNVAAFVLMGCPHSVPDGPNNLATVEAILQKFTKGKKNLLEPSCLESLVAACQYFKSLVDESKKPVLTIVEKRGMSKQMFGKKHIVSIQT